ncbi:efflux RND transporter periplasmic adaptor subunit [Calothrix sp. 336/3]|uniref:efflux RND transporter periplasmic adaptor subunit n=1 Tax=Calothrix sp. 336/3 TaxID=1337936 RepID=UPI0004E3BD0D|nr:efflux RND transporter periplasmic adaptor subunit [Calothrix sp. 336/3]AKG23234.1 hemolysin D [Calothrix sp. 336/3]
MKSSEPQNDFEENVPPQPLQASSRTRWKLWSLLAALTFLGGSVAAWRWLTPRNQESSVTKTQQTVAKVKIANVLPSIIEESSDYIASIKSRSSVKLQPKIPGQVTKMYVKSGDGVKAGDAMIQIDSKGQADTSGVVAVQGAKAELENARAMLKSLEAEKISKQADLKLYQQEYSRYTNLASQGAVSRQVKEQYSNRLAIAKANLAATDSKIKAQQATVSQSAKVFQQTQANSQQQPTSQPNYTINAPFTGTIGDVFVKVGDVVNNSTQLATLTQNRPLEVNISVPIERGLQLRKGMTVEILNPQGKALGKSRVFFISPSVTNNTQSVLVKALYDNSKDELRTDQLVRARVIWNQRPGVIIPVAAVAQVAGENTVFVVQTKTSPQGESQLVVHQQRVQLGKIKGSEYQVLEGLKAGDRVIVSGLSDLREGMTIIAE